jgi:hypothetical protein
MGSGVSFHGENGTLELHNNDYKIYDNKGKLIKSNRLASEAKPDVPITQTGPGFNFDKDHFANFFECLETRKAPHSIYNDCYKSVLLCHLANISYRTGRALHCDAANGKVQNDAEAMKLWTREYENGWQPSLT